MKKALALLLACLICLSGFSALAEYVTYPAACGLYSLELPDDYYIVDGSVIAELMTTEEGQSMLIELGISPEMVSSIDLSTMEYFYSGDFSGNLNINILHSGISMTLLRLMTSQLDAVITEQYKTLGVDESDMHPLGIVSYGENAFYGFEVSVFGLQMMQYIIADGDGNQYTLTFTNFDPAVTEHILTTFCLL